MATSSGCFDMHGREGPPIDAGATVDAPRLADTPSRADVPDPPVLRDASPAVDSGSDLCTRAIELMRGGTPAVEIGCDGRTFPRECVVPVGACCQLFVTCLIAPTDGGNLEASLTCDDSCDQSCGGQAWQDCALFPYCERFDPGACGPAPAGVIEGPACITRRGPPCVNDADCSVGARCAEYWVNPCAGLPCDACGGTERYCSF